MSSNFVSIFQNKPAFIEISKHLDNKSLNALMRCNKKFATWQLYAYNDNAFIQKIILINLGILQPFNQCDWKKTFFIVKRIRRVDLEWKCIPKALKIPQPNGVVDLVKFMAGDMTLKVQPSYWRLYQSKNDVYLAPSVNLIHSNIGKRVPILHYSLNELNQPAQFLGALEHENSYFRSMCIMHAGSVGITIAGVMSCTVTFWNLTTHQSLYSFELDPKFKNPLWISTRGTLLFTNNCLPPEQYYYVDLGLDF